MNHCHIFTNSSNCPLLSEHTFEERRFYYTQWNFTKTPGAAGELEACQKYWDSKGYEGEARIEDNYCKYTCTGNFKVISGVPSCSLVGPELKPVVTPDWINVQRESQCNLTPNGPYAYLGESGHPGAAFSTAQKDAIRQANKDANGGKLKSDAWTGLQMGQPLLDPHQFLKFNGALGVPNDDEPEPFPENWWSDDYVNIDHIIPRKDIHGCNCGPNSYANALVVSREINLRMSNNMEHEDRVVILAEHTN